jgi:hypothetical protein
MLRCFRLYLAGLLLSCAATLTAASEQCADVASSTLAEIEAGAGAPLTDDVAALVRRAAGSACVKARSGRYGAEQTSAAGAQSSVAIAESSASDANASTGSTETDTTKEDKKESSLWPFDAVKVNDVSASPSKKPYQRKR